ncbi:hypothetical protein [Halorussus caseinilyticus]|uniref:Sulfatase N-terminal domain-containing protein n=1 Tax=Halorussus caseinilyticus TaxID=3034025 RepID=A0ABD5WTT5_9EURY
MWEILRSDAPTLPTLRTGVEMFRSPPVNRATNDVSWAFDAMDAVEDADDQFLFANLMACHYPYDPPEGYADCEPLHVRPHELALREEPVSDEEHARQWECYRGAARYLDDELPDCSTRWTGTCCSSSRTTANSSANTDFGATSTASTRSWSECPQSQSATPCQRGRRAPSPVCSTCIGPCSKPRAWTCQTTFAGATSSRTT